MTMALTTILTLLTMAALDNNLDNHLLENIRQGNWWTGITGVFTSAIGEFFFAILFTILPIGLVYIKPQNVVPAAMILLISGSVFAALFTSPIRFFFAVCAIFGVAIVLFGVAHR